MKYKVTVISFWENPKEHYFDTPEAAHEFALAMKDQQYKVSIEEED